MKYTKPILLLFALLTLPVVAAAQSDEPQQKSNKSEIKVNKLDVIYEDEEYKGVVIDRRNDKETESYMYQAPFLLEDDVDEDVDDDDMPNIYTLDDEGVESEDDILLEGFDTAAIHLPKLDVDNIGSPIMIRLRDNARGEKFTWPTPWTARPSSHFGPRWRRFHYGLDLALPTGEPIYAAFDGVVRISKDNRTYGKLVIIHHNNGLETYYAHMSKRLVSAGQTVKSGDVIGLCGNTGRSRGSHLHFEVRYMGNAINPENVLDCSTHDLISDDLRLTSSSFRKEAKNNRRNYSGGSSSGAAGGEWYRVRNGDTLEKIARRNGTTIAQLCKLNNISRNKTIYAGQRLRVSGKASSKATSSKSSSKGGKATHTVRKGETLFSIATSNGMSVKELCQLNGISENHVIYAGQKLKVK